MFRNPSCRGGKNEPLKSDLFFPCGNQQTGSLLDAPSDDKYLSYEPVRCDSCHAYINCYVDFASDHSQFVCSICGETTILGSSCTGTASYDESGRTDPSDQYYCFALPETHAQQGACTIGARPKIIMYVLDMTPFSMQSGVFLTALRSIVADIERLRQLASCDCARVGILFFNTSVHWVHATSNKARIITFPQVNGNICLPPGYTTASLCSAAVSLLTLLRTMISDAEDAAYQALLKFTDISAVDAFDNAGMTALDCAVRLCQNNSGKVAFITCSAPTRGIGVNPLVCRSRSGESQRVCSPPDTVAIPGKLAVSSDLKTCLSPTQPCYPELAVIAATSSIAIDIYLCPGKESIEDLPNFAELARRTAGKVYYFPGFDLHRDGASLSSALNNFFHSTTYGNVLPPIGFHATLKLYTPNFVIIGRPYGHAMLDADSDIHLPCCDADTCIGYELELADTIHSKVESICVQSVLTFFDIAGTQRTVVETRKIPLTDSFLSYFESLNAKVFACLLGKRLAMSMRAPMARSMRSLMSSNQLHPLEVFRSEHHLPFDEILANIQAIMFKSIERYYLELSQLHFYKDFHLLKESTVDGLSFLRLADTYAIIACSNSALSSNRELYGENIEFALKQKFSSLTNSDARQNGNTSGAGISLFPELLYLLMKTYITRSSLNNNVTVDDRVFSMTQLESLGVIFSAEIIAPSVYKLTLPPASDVEGASQGEGSSGYRELRPRVFLCNSSSEAVAGRGIFIVSATYRIYVLFVISENDPLWEALLSNDDTIVASQRDIRFPFELHTTAKYVAAFSSRNARAMWPTKSSVYLSNDSTYIMEINAWLSWVQNSQPYKRSVVAFTHDHSECSSLIEELKMGAYDGIPSYDALRMTLERRLYSLSRKGSHSV